MLVMAMGVTWPWEKVSLRLNKGWWVTGGVSKGGRRWGSTNDHGVESETGHCCNADTLASGMCVEYFGGDDPA